MCGLLEGWWGVEWSGCMGKGLSEAKAIFETSLASIGLHMVTDIFWIRCGVDGRWKGAGDYVEWEGGRRIHRRGMKEVGVVYLMGESLKVFGRWVSTAVLTRWGRDDCGGCERMRTMVRKGRGGVNLKSTLSNQEFRRHVHQEEKRYCRISSVMPEPACINHEETSLQCTSIHSD
ncbi:hypothetical protein Tco_1211932 [Tanacetum coccineum]